MTIAKKIAHKCDGARAYTLAGGYAIHEGKRVLFPPGKLIDERRNEKGRVTFARYDYPDGSSLLFKYKEGAPLKLETLPKERRF